MPRTPRIDLADHCYHIINRANARVQIFCTDKDYQLFENLLEEAKEFLEDVIDKKKAVPYYRYRGKVPHRKQLRGHDAGRFPEKAAGVLLKILDSVEANAEFKGLYADRLRIIHVVAHRGRVIRKFIPRAFGRASPYDKHLTHIEIAVEEY